MDVRDGLGNYRDAVERAEVLDETIERTDALIDETVYELYGLTSEEIEIVGEAVGGWIGVTQKSRCRASVRPAGPSGSPARTQ